MAKTSVRWPSVTTIVKRYRELLGQATPHLIEQASVWYPSAREIAQAISLEYKVPIDRVCAVIAALSPRLHWKRNVDLTWRFFAGESLNCLELSIRNAQQALVVGAEALNGSKTKAFALAIEGDEESVVVDTWMLQAFRSPVESVTKKRYGDVVRAVKIVADETGLTPRTCQALLWIIARKGRVD